MNTLGEHKYFGELIYETWTLHKRSESVIRKSLPVSILQDDNS